MKYALLLSAFMAMNVIAQGTPPAPATPEQNPIQFTNPTAEEVKSIEGYAKKTVELVKKDKPDFGYDEASIKYLSDVLTKKRAGYSEKAKTNLPDIYGSYLGVAIIKEYGGRWIYIENTGYAVLINEKYFIFPMRRVQKHIENGEQDSIYSLYVSIPATIGLVDKAKTTSQ